MGSKNPNLLTLFRSTTHETFCRKNGGGTTDRMEDNYERIQPCTLSICRSMNEGMADIFFFQAIVQLKYSDISTEHKDITTDECTEKDKQVALRKEINGIIGHCVADRREDNPMSIFWGAKDSIHEHAKSNEFLTTFKDAAESEQFLHIFNSLLNEHRARTRMGGHLMYSPLWAYSAVQDTPGRMRYGNNGYKGGVNASDLGLDIIDSDDEGLSNSCCIQLYKDNSDKEHCCSKLTEIRKALFKIIGALACEETSNVTNIIREITSRLDEIDSVLVSLKKG